MEKLKIGLFIDTFYPMVDGVIQVVDQYATRLCKFADVTVFTTGSRKGKKDTLDHPYKVVRCKVMAVPGRDYDLALPWKDKAFRKAVDKADLDIVHIHSPFTIGKIGVKYAKKHNVPVIATLHSQYKQDFKKAVKMNWLANLMTSIIMKTFNQCDRCFAVNSKIAEIYHKDYKAKVLPDVLLNGTDFTPVADEKKAIEMVNEKFGLEKDIPVFLFVGRITELKNIFFTARALKILKEQGKKFKMIYVGSGPDEAKLASLVKELGLENEVIQAGRIMDRELLKSIYFRAKLFLFPSKYDANSLVQIEAASQKTPTVFLENTATSSSVTNDVNGFLVKDDINAYAQRIKEILEDDALYERVKKSAFEDLYHTWDDRVQVAYKIYQEYIEKKKAEQKKK